MQNYNAFQQPPQQKFDTSQLMKAAVMPDNSFSLGGAENQAFGGASQLSAPPMQVASDVNNGRGPVPANDPFFSTVNAGPPQQTAGAGPLTGPGAGRGYPSNWNSNNSPFLSGQTTTFATNPETGAAYEVSPMYQWQLAEGTKNLGRQMRAMGRGNSSFAANNYARLFNALAAQEADKQYNRTFAQQTLGQNAALQLAQMANNQGSLLGNLSLGGSNDIQNLIRFYAQQQAGNQLGLGTAEANAAIGLAGARAPFTTQIGQNTANLYAGLGQIPLEVLRYYNSIGR